VASKVVGLQPRYRTAQKERPWLDRTSSSTPKASPYEAGS